MSETPEQPTPAEEPTATRAALVLDGHVVNVIIVGPTYVPPDEHELIDLPDDSPVAPGWTYADGEWSAPERSAPDAGEEPEPSTEPTVAGLQAQLDAAVEAINELRATDEWLVGIVTTEESS